MDLLIAAVLLLQDKSAEETFKKIEERIEKAETLTVNFSLDATSGEEYHVTGSLLTKQGNRIDVRWKGSIGGVESTGFIKSNGMTMRYDLGPSYRGEKETPKNLSNGFATAMARTGIIPSLEMGNRPDQQDRTAKEDIDFKERFVVSNFETGADDGGKKTLQYTLQVMRGSDLVEDPKFRVRIWYHPETYALAKREMSNETNKTKCVEVYQMTLVNANVSDEKFKFPADK